jgi:KDO2-lipid IV(A) lauroyltransferase
VARGKGVIIMTGHFSNWELMGTWVVRHGYPVKVVSKKSYDPRLDKLIVDYRNEAGYANTSRGSATRSVIDGLINGETFGLLFDLDTKVKGVFVDFFGQPAHTATIPVLLATKLNVPIVPMFCRLTKKNTYVFTCLEELKLVNTGDDEKDTHLNTQICSDVYQKMITTYPDQWIWMHRRWKKKPDANDPYYKYLAKG